MQRPTKVAGSKSGYPRVWAIKLSFELAATTMQASKGQQSLLATPSGPQGLVCVPSLHTWLNMGVSVLV